MKEQQEKTEIKKVELFTLINHNGKIRICVGNTCVHHAEFNTFEEAEKVIKKRDWELIINTTAFCIEQMKKGK